MMITTYEDFDARINTVYDENGVRIGANETFFASGLTIYYNAELVAVSYDDYLAAVGGNVDIRG